MFRSASRSVLRSAQSSLAPARTAYGRRFLTTEPPHLKSRSWKSSAARWGIAFAGLYYYNTSPLFAQQPSNNLLNPNLDALDDLEESTLDAIAARRNERQKSALESALNSTSTENASITVDGSHVPTPTDPSTTPAELEAEAEGEGAFNPVTGEINWDCPCLGGMAHGPCGPEFREAFSCFVYSTDEPKGMDCIDKFKGMQDCFQKYPEVYKGELEDDDEIDEALEAEKQELAHEIDERIKSFEERDKVEAEAEADRPQRRLLEEPGPVSESKSKSRSKPESNVKPPASSEPHPGMSDEHERHINEVQSSRQASPPKPHEVGPVTSSDRIVPKASFDARGN